MFSKLKHRFDGKSKRLSALMLAAVLLCGISGCSKEQVESPQNYISSSTNESVSETGFDIERIRKNIVVDGQVFEIPLRLKNLPKDWTYDVSTDNFIDEGTCRVQIKDNNGKLISSCRAEDYKASKIENSVIYEAPFDIEDCSVDGMIISKSTKQEVVEKYGNPERTKKYDDPNWGKHYGWEEYQYGILEKVSSYKDKRQGKCLLILFDEETIVQRITIVYTN